MDLPLERAHCAVGLNPAWSRAGVQTYDYMQCKAAGTKFISVDVNYNSGARSDR